MAILPLGDFVWFGDDTEQTRILLHDESHYAAAIPGAPQAVAGPTESSVVVRARDLPIEIEYRMDRNPRAANAEAFAGTLATAHAMQRAAEPPRVAPIVTLLPRGASAAASALYSLGGDALELVVVTIAPGDRWWTLYQSCRFRAANVQQIEWTNFRTALLYYQSWIENKSPDVHPWPQSALAEPSARMTLTTRAAAEAQRKAAELALTDEQATQLADMLLGFSRSDDPPALPIGRATLEVAALTLAGTGIDRAPEILLRNLDEVKTTFDFRAWCHQCRWAIEHRRR